LLACACGRRSRPGPPSGTPRRREGEAHDHRETRRRRRRRGGESGQARLGGLEARRGDRRPRAPGRHDDRRLLLHVPQPHRALPRGLVRQGRVPGHLALALERPRDAREAGPGQGHGLGRHLGLRVVDRQREPGGRVLFPATASGSKRARMPSFSKLAILRRSVVCGVPVCRDLSATELPKTRAFSPSSSRSLLLFRRPGGRSPR